MRCRLREAALVITLVLALPVAPADAEPGSQDAVNGWLTFEHGGDVIREEVVVRDHLPEFLHWVHDDPERRHLDHFTDIGFDEDSQHDPRQWVGDDNWHNADEKKDEIDAWVYGGLVAVTANQFYVVYYYFHPRDYAGTLVTRTLGQGLAWIFGQAVYHENDLEGGMLVVDRRSGEVIHVLALAHNGFDQRHLCSGDGDCWDRDDLDDAIVWVEPAGHGAGLIQPRRVEEVPPERDFLVRYQPVEGAREAGIEPGARPEPTPSAEVRSVHRRMLWEREWHEIPVGARYRLLPLWPLFTAMYGDDRRELAESRLYAKRFDTAEVKFRGYFNRGRLSTYKTLRGRHGGDDKAHFPWGQDLDKQRLLDPAVTVLNYEDTGREPHRHDPISCEYEFNPYLHSFLQETVLSGTTLTVPFPWSRSETWLKETCPGRKKCAECSG